MMNTENKNDKLRPQTFKGIDFIQIEKLPQEQSTLLLEWAQADHIITIKMEGKLVKNCIQFSDYSYWFDHIFDAQRKPVTKQTSAPLKKLRGLAYDNS